MALRERCARLAGVTAVADVSRLFTLEDQRAFARASGDANPLHVDPVAARRTMFGAPVVHGVHLVLWALDTGAARARARWTLERLQAQFHRPCYLHRNIQLHVEVEATSLKAVARSDSGVVLQLGAELSEAELPSSALFAAPTALEPYERSFDEAATARGALALGLDGELVARLFPALVSRLSALQLAEVLATTRLVGMDCPGLHSVYTGLKLARATEPAGGIELTYSVAAANVRYSMLKLDVAGPTLSGTLETFYRPPPRPPLAMSEVARSVRADELSDQRALVVGGSRGLGEATAKAIVAAGGVACVTYHRGRDDGERVARELRAVRGGCAALLLDVGAATELAKHWPVDWAPTHLYYFATPFIRIDKGAPFEPVALAEFLQVYVHGLHATVSAVCSMTQARLTVVAPSTVYLESLEPGSTSYCVAKAAMEELARHLPRLFPVQVAIPRLPRTETDQTASLLGATGEPPLRVAINMLRSVAARHR
jgi:acyl dehydratase